jgi:hypothetical protein
VFVLVQILILLSAVLYSLGVACCHLAPRELLRGEGGADVSAILRYTLLARVGVIALYSYSGIAILRFGGAAE